MTTTAKIAAKGCNGTGITDEIAESLQLQVPGDHTEPSVQDVIDQGKGVLADGEGSEPRLIDPDDETADDLDDEDLEDPVPVA